MCLVFALSISAQRVDLVFPPLISVVLAELRTCPVEGTFVALRNLPIFAVLTLVVRSIGEHFLEGFAFLPLVIFTTAVETAFEEERVSLAATVAWLRRRLSQTRRYLCGARRSRTAIALRLSDGMDQSLGPCWRLIVKASVWSCVT